MSIRHKIFSSVLAGLFMGLLFSSFVAWQAWVGHTKVVNIVSKVNISNQAVGDIVDQFASSNRLIERVMAMTDFVSADEIKTGFEGSTLALKKTITTLKASVLSSQMGTLVTQIEKEYVAWVADSSLVLGLARADQIPTIEKISRHKDQLERMISSATKMQGRDANGIIEQSGAAMKSALITASLMSIVAMLIGSIGAFILARNISLPLTKLVSAAEQLSAGNTEIEFKCLTRRDEIGAVGRAIAGFRDNVLESARLAEASRSDQSERDERQRRVEGLIEEFSQEANLRLVSVEEQMSRYAANCCGCICPCRRNGAKIRKCIGRLGCGLQQCSNGGLCGRTDGSFGC